MAPITYIDAINRTLHEEIARDPTTFLIGEDTGIYGGVFKATKGLLEEFGPDRIIDSPISESLIAGMAVGAAMVGCRPIPEIQFADFISPAFDQIVQQLARYHWRTVGAFEMPVTIRCPYGGGVGGGVYHSQSVESWFMNTPGLVMVAPGTVRDAAGLLRAAIRSQDPVLYWEHKKLYRSLKDELPEGEEVTTEIGRAEIAREGSDVTAISFGYIYRLCLEAAEALAGDGIEVEVVDLKTLLPLDVDTIVASVAKTGRAVIVHEAPRTGGIGGEIAAVLAERCFWELDAPIVRVCGHNTSFPAASTMEAHYMPTADGIAAVLKRTAEM
ncbi:MAG TPA: alpha-ketoacid dehydrogenase subunit beta [Gemmatimonadota bacterium]|nr:alpha-ketoacid dehydrogenase subunit beta [Gemmatimonadota bacterium]